MRDKPRSFSFAAIVLASVARGDSMRPSRNAFLISSSSCRSAGGMKSIHDFELL
jgi:hypothetical protein